MQLWRIRAGLTAAFAVLAVLVGASRLDCMVPFWQVVLEVPVR